MVQRVGCLLAVGMLVSTSLLGGVTPPASAQESACATEVEPNDVAESLAFLTGRICLEGTLPSGDQDLLLWEVSPAEAAIPWTLVVDGVDGTLTSVRVLPIVSEPGVVPLVRGTQIVQVDSAPEDVGPVERPGLLLPSGRFMLGISRSGMPDGTEPRATEYRLSLEPGEPLVGSAESEPNDTPSAATRVEETFSVVADAAASADHFAWTIGGTPDGEAWALDVTGTIGQDLSIILHGEDGAIRGFARQDAWGHIILPDLQLGAGTYDLYLATRALDVAPYRLSASLGPAMGDAEPNNSAADSVAFEAGSAVARGRLFPAGDVDRHRLIIADDRAVLRDIKLFGPEEFHLSVCLAREEGTTLQCSQGMGGATLRSLLLSPGGYQIVISGDEDRDRPYLVRVDATAEPVPDFEVEPNDDPSTATPFDASITLRGMASSGEYDVFRLTTSGEAQLWEVRMSGTDIERFAWIRADGAVLANGHIPPIEHTSAVVTDLYLVPGVHWFRASGGGDYQITATPLGPPHPEGEREPNDDASFAQPYRLGRTRMIGRLPSPMDRDVFRFSLAAPERVTLRVDPPADGAVSLRLEAGGRLVGQRRSLGPGVPIWMETRLGPGDHEVWLGADVPSEGRYDFTLERGDPLLARDDEEPNGRPDQASALPATLRVLGDLPSGDDLDWYRLPQLDASSPVTVIFEGDISHASFSDGVMSLPAAYDHATRSIVSDGASGLVPRYLSVVGSGAYELRVEAPGLQATAEPAPLPITAALAMQTDAVAAYWPGGQRLRAALELANDGESPIELALDAVTSHFAWEALPSEVAVTLAPGERRSIPVNIAIGPDAWADDPVQITLRARSGSGAQVTAVALVTPLADAEPVAPEPAWSVPDALLGGLDVASLALGARTIPSIAQVEEDQLHDGHAHTGLGFSQSVSSLPMTLTVDLAGGAPVPVAGFALNPQGGKAVAGDVPRDVELLLSTDGTSFATALTASLSERMGDQWFVLPEPVRATHAQLRITSVHGGSWVTLGEWKVVAVPGTVADQGPIDLAQPVRGGHVAWMEPQPPVPDTFRQFLDEDPKAVPLYPEAGSSLMWVIGFQDARAAQITELRWVDPIPSTKGQRFTDVDVEVSLEGAAGPWHPLGAWALDRAPDGSVSPFVLPEPTWARYLRLTSRVPRKATGAWDPPSAIHVLERPTGPEYRSIVGEWGAGEPVGPYEWLLPPDVSVPLLGEDDGDTPESARDLVAGSPASGRVDHRSDVDWYTFTIPDGDNTLALELVGRPIVTVALTLFDLEGLELPMLFGAGDTPGSVRYEAEVTPGASYRLRVEQPPSSIVFTFDTSMSMGPYLEYMYQAMRAFVADVTPGEEFVSIVPFEEDPLLEDWSDDPFLLADAVGRFVPSGGSSSVETALIDAATALSAREGARAVLIVTDGETTSFDRTAELWRVMSSVRPLVAAIHVGATNLPDTATAAMQDHARVAGGFYQYTRSHGEMDRAFERIATWLRRPAGYELRLATRFQETPPESAKPGSISVASPVDGSNSLSPDVGLEIILDTSGSMLKKLKGRPRIELAKEVLADLVAERLPDGAPVAVRVLGDADDVCGTRLVVPLGPLDPDAVIDRVNDIEVLQKTDTPLGAALGAVPGDLAGSTGTRIVLLITDSQEVWPHPDLCGQDPAAAVRALRRRGIDARLNIVGLQVKTRKATAQLRRWARLGNGSFFSANDADQLGSSIRTAVSAPFRILDASGNEVASGTVDGAAVPVPPGVYSVVVLTDPVARFDGVEVEPGAGAGLQLPNATAPPFLEPLPTAAP